MGNDKLLNILELNYMQKIYAHVNSDSDLQFMVINIAVHAISKSQAVSYIRILSCQHMKHLCSLHMQYLPQHIIL